MTDIDVLNKMLKDQYGTDLLSRPVFRVVWSERQFEKRCGTFSEYSGSVFLREWSGIKECKKYPGPDYSERWILEKLMTGIVNPELWEDTSKGTYEPIWVFRDPSDGSYQKPTWKAVYFILQTLLEGKPPKMDQKQLDSQEKTEIDAEIKHYMEVIDGKCGGVDATSLHFREAIVVPHNYEAK